MTCEKVENFFKDGKYSMKITILPICRFPQGDSFTGESNIRSLFNCDGTQFCSKRLDDRYKREGIPINFQFNFLSTCKYVVDSDAGSAGSGDYKINGNVLTVYYKGYSFPLGGIYCIKKTFTVDSKNNILAKTYYRNKKCNYELYWIDEYTKIE